MRAVHPEYEVVTVACACGAEFQTRSTKSGEYTLDICSECHPFYTGTQKIVDSEGRVERFRKKFAAAQDSAAARKKKRGTVQRARKPPKMGKVVPIEVKPAKERGRPRFGGGGARGSGFRRDSRTSPPKTSTPKAGDAKAGAPEVSDPKAGDARAGAPEASAPKDTGQKPPAGKKDAKPSDEKGS